MASRKGRPEGEVAVSTSKPPRKRTSAPPPDLNVSRMIWPKGQTIHRIHQEQYQGSEFNPGVKGNARFSPIEDSEGKPIPTLYGGTTFDCAAMETVFHDVPFAPGFKSYDKRKLTAQIHSQISSKDDLVLADLSSVALRKLGVQRGQLIDTEKDRYPETRQWGEAIHAQCPDVQGLCWVSRQDDRARALMLFGDRVPADSLVQQGSSRSISSDENAYADIVSLADRIGVNLVVSKS
jgi:hypothetical protein